MGHRFWKPLLEVSNAPVVQSITTAADVAAYPVSSLSLQPTTRLSCGLPVRCWRPCSHGYMCGVQPLKYRVHGSDMQQREPPSDSPTCSNIALNMIYSGGRDAAAGGGTQRATCAVHAMHHLIKGSVSNHTRITSVLCS